MKNITLTRRGAAFIIAYMTKADYTPRDKNIKREKSEREEIIDIISEILDSEAYNNIALRRALGENASLTERQKAYVTEAVNGTLRNLLLIDNIIDGVSSVKAAKMKPLIRNALRAAVYQLKFMNSPKDYAICSETVEIVRKNGLDGLAGFVNGVLRGAQRIDKRELFCLPDEKTSPAEFLSLKYSVPKWLVDMWIRDFGYNETKKMCGINSSPPDVVLRVNTLKTSPDELSRILLSGGADVAVSGNFSGALHVSGIKDIANSQAFKDGAFHVMDESAMFAVKALGPKPGDRVLDVCAAPGGKAFYAAELMRDKGEITANDIFVHKLELIKSGAKRLGIKTIKTSLCDATKENAGFINKFDRVLVDAPCTGFGVIRKKPDIKYTKTEQSIQETAELQRKILAQAVKYVKPGGTLVYSTCTLTKAENGDNAAWLAENSGFELSSEKTILPQHYGSDGFYIAAFKNI